MKDRIVEACLSARKNYGLLAPTDDEIAEFKARSIVTVGTAVSFFFGEFCDDPDYYQMYHDEVEKYLADEVIEVPE